MLKCESGCAQNLGKKQQTRRADSVKGFSGGMHAKLSDVKASNRRPREALWSALSWPRGFVSVASLLPSLPKKVIYNLG